MAEKQNTPETSSPGCPVLDVEKLHSLPSEQQDLFLLTFTSDLTRHIAGLSKDQVGAQQASLRQEFMKVVTLSSPVPSRVIRNNIGQCFSGIFSKGDRKGLFETVKDLSALLTSGKGDRDVVTKHAAVHCLGAVLEAAGDSAISQATGACFTILRMLKPSQNYAGFRASLFRALGRIIKGINKSADEAICRDIWKQCRSSASGDKSLLVQRASCWCMERLIEFTTYFDNSNDFDKLQSTIWKTFDSGSPSVRRAAASCLAAILVKSYSARPDVDVRRKKTIKLKSRPVEDGPEEQEIERPGTPTSSKPITGIAFSISEILRVLSGQYCRPSTSNRTRAAIIYCYTRVFQGLGERIVETEFASVATHFFYDILNNMNITNNRYRLLISRKFTRLVLGGVVCRQILGETAQISFVKYLVNSILKDYPQSEIKERPEPSKETLIGALDLLNILINHLGSATSAASDTCRDALLQVLQHPSYSVQIHTAKCLQSLVIACPNQLLPSTTICMNSVNREIGQLNGPRRSTRRCIGLAHGLAAAISASSTQPLYGSVDIYSRAFAQATTILKSSSSSDLRISSAQIQVAWIIISGIMSLGPSFVKIHLSQLLMLWKNALPKPLGKSNIGKQSLLEISFLAHVRECALGSIRSFLTFNSRLLTLDVSKRLAVMLQNTTEFLQNLPQKKLGDDTEKLLSVQLHEYDLMIRRQVFECYMELINSSPVENHDELLQSGIVSLAGSSLADPITSPAGSLSISLAASSANFESIWDIGDGSGFGLTSLVRDLYLKPLTPYEKDDRRHWLVERSIEANIDNTIRSPMCGALEHDQHHLYRNQKSESPCPVGTGVVDAAIRFFAVSLPLQSSKVQQGVIEQVSSLLAEAKEQQSPAREAAVSINVAAALLYALKVANRETSISSGEFRGSETEKAFQEIFHDLIVHNDPAIRNLVAEAIGRVCKIFGNEFTTREVNYLVELIVSNREPQARAGCASALGCIHAELGGMAAGFHLKNILGVLSSLAMDPHPTVHFWALNALSKVADSAGLAFSGYVSNSLGMVTQLYVVESHNEEGSSVGFSNLQIELPTEAAIARCVNSMINVLGPDIQDMAKTRSLVLSMTYQFQMENNPLITIESLKSLEHLSLYAPSHISFAPYIRQLQARIISDHPDIQQVALTGLSNAMRRGAEDTAKTADDSLEDQLWLVLNQTYGSGTARDILMDWVEQSGISSVELWIHRVRKVLTKIKPSTEKKVREAPKEEHDEPDLRDEDIAGLNAKSQNDHEERDTPAEEVQELLRWQVRSVAMDCLYHILARVAKENDEEKDAPAVDGLQPWIAEIIKIAFSASTAAVIEIRLLGINVIGKILQIFGKMTDPDFPEAALLEQYQAQISSALTPAFASDSSPLLAAAAVHVCASFIATGIVTDVDRMGRILKLLVTALEDFSKKSELASIGDLKGLSSNALVMVKLAVFTAWAELQIASHEQTYLNDVLRPHLVRLTPLWLTSLQEYARLKFEPGVPNASMASPSSSDLDTLYVALNRQVLLQFYQSSWLRFVIAIASLIDEDSDFVLNSLDYTESHDKSNGVTSQSNDISYRNEPAAFFFVLFGVSFEALISSATSSEYTSPVRTLEILEAMKSILKPAVTGMAIYQDAIFTEFVDILDRLVLTEGPEIQSVIIDIAHNLCTNHPSARRLQRPSDDEENLSEDIDQLFELSRPLVLTISTHISALSDGSTPARADMSDDAAALVVQALGALVDAAQVFPTIIKSDLHACIFHIFATVLSTGSCQAKLIPRMLPVFREFVSELAQAPQHETQVQLRSALARFLVILKNAQRRESDAAVPCEKNTLLAATLLLASTAKLFPARDPLVVKFVDELADCLSNRLTAKFSAGLSRTLLILPTVNATTKDASPSDGESAIAAQLLPQLIDFLVHPSEIEGTEETRPVVAQTLATFATSVPADKRIATFMLVVPAFLERAEIEEQSVWLETSKRLLELAQKEPSSFKAVVAQLNAEKRSLLEEVIRFGGGLDAGGNAGANGDVSEMNKEPSIALKLDF